MVKYIGIIKSILQIIFKFIDITTKYNEWIVFGFWFDPIKCKINFWGAVGIFFIKGHYVKP